MLDGWWTGTIERICREAPAPVVDMTPAQFAPGGAANTAMNLAALGARVSMVGIDRTRTTPDARASCAGCRMPGVDTACARGTRRCSDHHQDTGSAAAASLLRSRRVLRRVPASRPAAARSGRSRRPGRQRCGGDLRLRHRGLARSGAQRAGPARGGSPLAGGGRPRAAALGGARAGPGHPQRRRRRRPAGPELPRARTARPPW